VALFQEVNKDQPNVHHDALELPDGQIVLVTKLREGSTRRCCNCQPERVSRRAKRSKPFLWSECGLIRPRGADLVERGCRRSHDSRRNR
jgi:hypothetical protein